MSPALSHLKLTMVDTFTRTPFDGGKVAVCLLTDMQRRLFDEERLAKLVGEIGAPETAFVVKTGDAAYALARHAGGGVSVSARLATAHVLWSEGHVGHGTPVTVEADGARHEVKKRSDHLATTMPMTHGGARLVELASQAELAAFRPKAAAFGAARHLLATARGEKSLADVFVRTFLRDGAVREVETVEAAHAELGAHWLERLPVEVLLGEQRVAGRSAKIHFERSATPGHVVIAGQFATTFKGLFVVTP